MKRVILAFAAVMALAGPALAVDLTTQITQLDGKSLIGPGGKEVTFMVGDAIKNALLTTDQQTKPDDKNKRFWLAVKVNDAMNAKKDITFTPQELTDIEKALNENQSILVAGQAIRIIDPTSIPK